MTRNLIRDQEWSDIKGGVFWLNGLDRFLAKTRLYKDRNRNPRVRFSRADGSVVSNSSLVEERIFVIGTLLSTSHT